jgi:pantothenate synthetase
LAVREPVYRLAQSAGAGVNFMPVAANLHPGIAALVSQGKKIKSI